MEPIQVAVLLATYNGEKYLEEQITSILNQKDVEVELYVHDDFSKDNTLKIIEKLSESYPDQIKIINSAANLGVVKTYQFLLDQVVADYYFFSDQDDVWFDNKIINEVNMMAEFNNQPSLVYSDLEIVDSDLNVISESMFSHMNVKNTNQLEKLLVQNVITGNTVGFNRKLRDLVINSFRMDSKHVLMHDGWLGLVAASYGKLLFLDRATVKYRQHGNNVVGARKSHFTRIFQIEKLRKAVLNTILQAKILNEKMKNYNHTDAKTIRLIDEYAKILECNPVQRFFILLRNGYRKQGIVRNIIFYMLVVTEKGSKK